jgi:hypothetical protein
MIQPLTPLTISAAMTPKGTAQHNNQSMTNRASTPGTLTTPPDSRPAAIMVGRIVLWVGRRAPALANDPPSTTADTVVTAMVVPLPRFVSMKTMPLATHVAARIADCRVGQFHCRAALRWVGFTGRDEPRQSPGDVEGAADVDDEARSVL